MFKNIGINIITILCILFLYTGFFLQQDIVGALSRTYNSAAGLILVLYMVFLMSIKKDYKPKVKPIVKPFVLFWIILLLFQTLLTSDSIGRALITFYYVTVWPISYMFFYRISKNSLYEDQIVSNRFLILIFTAVFLYSITAYASFVSVGFSGSVGNSYYLLCLFPWALIIPNKKVKMLVIIILSLFILISMKRTPIIVLAGVSIIYAATANQKQSFFAKIFAIIFVIAFGIALVYYVDSYILDGHMVERFINLERGADTRGEIREIVLEMYTHASVEKKLLGHGYNSVVATNPLELSAHNDYIETLFDHGFIVLLLQIVIIIKLFYLSYKLYRIRSFYFAPMISSVLLYSVSAYATHMVLYPYYFLFISGFWGYIEGKYVSKNL